MTEFVRPATESSFLFDIFHTHSIQFETNLNSTTNITTSSNSSCHAILSQLGSFSKDNGLIEYGICPETWLSSSLSIFILVSYLIVLVICGIGLFLKRNSKHIRARHPIYMIMTLFASSWCILTLCLRFAIGRKFFPCGIYLLSYFALPGAVILPSIFRLFRLYYMHLMNLHKTNIFTLDEKQSSSKKRKQQQLNVQLQSAAGAAVVRNESVESELSTTTIQLIQKQQQQQNSTTWSTPMTPSTTTTMVPSSTTNHNTNNNTNTTSTAADIDNVVDSQMSVVDRNDGGNDGNGTIIDTNVFDLDIDSNTNTYNTGMDMDSTSWVNPNEVFEFHEVVNSLQMEKFNLFRIFNRIFKNSENSHRMMNFLVSYKFIVPVYVFVSIIHVLIFVILGGIEFGMQKNNSKLNENGIFATEGGGIYIFHRGCSSTTNTLIVVALTTIFYMIFEIMGLVLFFFTDKDTFYIKREALFIVIIQFMTIVLFVIFSFIPIFKFLLDFFIPFGYLFIVYSFIEVIVSVLMPIIYSIRYDRKMSEIEEQNSELRYFLLKKKNFNLMLDFARRSYAPESILCFKHVETFKKTNRKNRLKVALVIVNTYLKQGSPLELNYPKLVETQAEILEILENPNTNVPIDIFDKISIHCLNDMLDIFERLKSHNKEAKKIVEEWRAVNVKPMPTTTTTGKLGVLQQQQQL